MQCSDFLDIGSNLKLRLSHSVKVADFVHVVYIL